MSLFLHRVISLSPNFSLNSLRLYNIFILFYRLNDVVHTSDPLSDVRREIKQNLLDFFVYLGLPFSKIFVRLEVSLADVFYPVHSSFCVDLIQMLTFVHNFLHQIQNVVSIVDSILFSDHVICIFG